MPNRGRSRTIRDAGELRERVTLETATTVENTTGGRTTTWGTPITVWARVRALQGREVFDLAQLEGQVVWEVLIRYRTGVGPESRVTLPGSRVIHVEAAVPDEKRTTLRLVGTERRVS